MFAWYCYLLVVSSRFLMEPTRYRGIEKWSLTVDILPVDTCWGLGTSTKRSPVQCHINQYDLNFTPNVSHAVKNRQLSANGNPDDPKYVTKSASFCVSRHSVRLATPLMMPNKLSSRSSQTRSSALHCPFGSWAKVSMGLEMRAMVADTKRSLCIIGFGEMSARNYVRHIFNITGWFICSETRVGLTLISVVPLSAQLCMVWW